MTETGRIAPSGVRYIKLGKGGGWERECLADGIARRVVDDGRGVVEDEMRRAQARRSQGGRAGGAVRRAIAVRVIGSGMAGTIP